MKKSESISKLAVALLKAQKEMGDATKGAKNPFFKSSFADLNSVREAVMPALNANGISVLQPHSEENGKSYVETLLLHESGEWLSSSTEIVTNKQNDPQAAGSGISYARRYSLQSLLSIGSVDDDGEAAMGRGRQFKPELTHKATAEAAVKEVLKERLVTATPVTGEAAPIKKSSFRKPSETPKLTEATGDGWEN